MNQRGGCGQFGWRLLGWQPFLLPRLRQDVGVGQSSETLEIGIFDQIVEKKEHQRRVTALDRTILAKVSGLRVSVEMNQASAEGTAPPAGRG